MHIALVTSSTLKLRKAGSGVLGDLSIGKLLIVAFVIYSVVSDEEYVGNLTEVNPNASQICIGMVLIFVAWWLINLGKTIYTRWLINHIFDHNTRSYHRNNTHVVDFDTVQSVELIASRHGSNKNRYTKYVINLVENPEAVYEVVESRHQGNLVHVSASIARMIGCPLRIEQYR